MYDGAWLVYLVAAFLLCGYVWWLTRGIRFSIIRHALRVWLAILLFVPAASTDAGTELAPAFIVFIFEAMRSNVDAALPKAAPLIAAFSIATLVIIVVPLVNWIRRPKNGSATDQKTSEEQAN